MKLSEFDTLEDLSGSLTLPELEVFYVFLLNLEQYVSSYWAYDHMGFGFF